MVPPAAGVAQTEVDRVGLRMASILTRALATLPVHATLGLERARQLALAAAPRPAQRSAG